MQLGSHDAERSCFDRRMTGSHRKLLYREIAYLALQKYKYIVRHNKMHSSITHREIILNQTEIRLYLPFSE